MRPKIKDDNLEPDLPSSQLFKQFMTSGYLRVLKKATRVFVHQGFLWGNVGVWLHVDWVDLETQWNRMRHKTNLPSDGIGLFTSCFQTESHFDPKLC